MVPYANILHQAARFWAGLPPDMATYLLAVLENPHGLADALVWALNAWGGELFVVYTVAILVRCLWPRLPTGIQRVILKVWGYVWPWAESRNGNPELAELEVRVQELERRLGSRSDDPADSTEVSEEKRAGS